MHSTTEDSTGRRATGVLAPTPELWEALDDGARLREALEVFYTRVYADERLAHFFEGVTRDRAIEKQFSFLKSIFTGERCYFGFRPRNAHHWMVISDELFDYREALLDRTLREHALPAETIERIRAIDEVFRKQIVKDAPFPRKMGGQEQPLEGYETIAIAGGTICDACEAPIDDGALASYHRRTGKAYCELCHPLETENGGRSDG